MIKSNKFLILPTNHTVYLVVVTTRQNFDARGRLQQNRVLVLRYVRSLDVTQRRVRLNQAVITQILERHVVSGFTDTVQVSLAEGQRTKVAINGTQKLLGARKSKRYVTDVVILHVMAAFAILDNVSASRNTERNTSQYSYKEGKNVKRVKKDEMSRPMEAARTLGVLTRR